MEPLIHFGLVFAALFVFGIGPKIALLASLFTLAPDLDILFGIHPWFSHSLVILIVVGLLLVFLLRRTRLRNFAPLALFAVLLHPVFDAFCGYTPIFWPVLGESVWINLGISMSYGSSLGIGHNVEVLTRPTTFEHFSSFDAPLLTGAGVIIFVMLVIPVLLVEIRKGKAVKSEKEDITVVGPPLVDQESGQGMLHRQPTGKARQAATQALGRKLDIEATFQWRIA